MPFSEQTTLAVKKKANFRCCLCYQIFVEIHHILPQAEGGPDTEDNAAPLCPSCHETYGANPEKRKFIREAREYWYEKCAAPQNSNTKDLEKILEGALKRVATKDYLENLSAQHSSYVLGAGASSDKMTLELLPYSFSRENFIHPRIIQEMEGWLSDRYSSVVAIDLLTANTSNRFYGDIWKKEYEDGLWIGWDGDQEQYSYRHLGVSPSGIHMVLCHHWTGGSGRFIWVHLFGFDHDRALEESRDKGLLSRERILLKMLGSVPLGDRYSGEVCYRDGMLIVGPDVGLYKRGAEAEKAIPIK